MKLWNITRCYPHIKKSSKLMMDLGTFIKSQIRPKFSDCRRDLVLYLFHIKYHHASFSVNMGFGENPENDLAILLPFLLPIFLMVFLYE